jgi:hypothetical protein
MAVSLTIIIVDKSGSLKTLTVKEYKEEELFKKCGFKKAEGFKKHTEWNNVKIDGEKYSVCVYAKDDGKANSENKYDFPPPIDNKLFFGSCALVGYIKNDDGTKVLTNLSISLWEKIYEKLFGGFENLAVTTIEDEEEEDELANVPKEKKTKHGYLKDGFVVDSDDDENNYDDESDFETLDDNDSDSNGKDQSNELDGDIIQDIGSELSEESYHYDD